MLNLLYDSFSVLSEFSKIPGTFGEICTLGTVSLSGELLILDDEE